MHLGILIVIWVVFLILVLEMGVVTKRGFVYRGMDGASAEFIVWTHIVLQCIGFYAFINYFEVLK
nr:MAG TPA: hypothetical protein [Caudoviricetes sp.]